MFFFLCQFIQNVMGYSPLRPASRSCRSASASWSRAGVSSNLVNRIDPRWLAGIGTLMAGAGLFGVLPAARTTTPAPAVARTVDAAATSADVLPFIVLMSIGMGMTFVPLTLTAVHHLRRSATPASGPAC